MYWHTCHCDFESDESSHDEGDDADPLKNIPKLQKLKIFREKVNDWEIKEQRFELLRQIYPVIKKWRTELPDLREVFRREEIDQLLRDSLEYEPGGWFDYPGKQFVRFVLRTGYKDSPDVDESGKPLSRRTTALHSPARICSNYEMLVDELFQIYDRFDVNYTDEGGFTHFHAACQAGLQNVVGKFLELGQDPNCVWPKTGDSGLHFALINEHNHLVPMLLKYRANPNLANAEGLTALHSVCMRDDDPKLVSMLFALCDDPYKPVRVDAQDESGETPLHYATSVLRKNVLEYLLRKGANPNLADAKGLTPLHLVCQDYRDGEYEEVFFQIVDEQQRKPVKDEAEGNYAILQKHKLKIVIELLLRNGSDPSLTDLKEMTPLHFICQRYYDDDIVDAFFAINDDLQQTVKVDARNNLGRTPLQLAVVNILPHVVGVLLDHCADLSSFVFPTEAHFAEASKPWTHHINFKLRLATGALAVIERLGNGGYELDRSDALTIMKLFADFGLFKKSADQDEHWYEDQEFAEEAKEIMIMISPRVSLYDLMQKRPEETVRILKFSDYFNLRCSEKKWIVPEKYRAICTEQLCEKLLRGFCRQWTLDHFLELTCCNLPIECCERIIKLLMNEDLCNVCFAAIK